MGSALLSAGACRVKARQLVTTAASSHGGASLVAGVPAVRQEVSSSCRVKGTVHVWSVL